MTYNIAYSVGRKIWIIHWKASQFHDKYDITQHTIKSILINEHSMVLYKIRYHSIDVWLAQANMFNTQKDAANFLKGYLRGLEDDEIEITTRKGEQHEKTKRNKRQDKTTSKSTKDKCKKSDNSAD